jgi:hypothetical protein
MVERRSIVSRQLRAQRREPMPIWEQIVLSIFFLIIIGATIGIYQVDHREYWDAYGCINHLDGSTYDATADKLSEFPAEDTCKEYVHRKG